MGVREDEVPADSEDDVKGKHISRYSLKNTVIRQRDEGKGGERKGKERRKGREEGD